MQSWMLCSFLRFLVLHYGSKREASHCYVLQSFIFFHFLEPSIGCWSSTGEGQGELRAISEAQLTCAVVWSKWIKLVDGNIIWCPSFLFIERVFTKTALKFIVDPLVPAQVLLVVLVSSIVVDFHLFIIFHEVN